MSLYSSPSRQGGMFNSEQFLKQILSEKSTDKTVHNSIDGQEFIIYDSVSHPKIEENDIVFESLPNESGNYLLVGNCLVEADRSLTTSNGQVSGLTVKFSFLGVDDKIAETRSYGATFENNFCKTYNTSICDVIHIDIAKYGKIDKVKAFYLAGGSKVNASRYIVKTNLQLIKI